MNQNNYNFSDYNLNIATYISQRQFEIYSQFINKLRPLENIIQAYKMVQEQYFKLQMAPQIIENLPILNERGHDLAVQETTIYIMLNRMFIDNCKNLMKQLPDLEFKSLINLFDKSPCEENLRVLRNYANHTTIPITGLTIESSSNSRTKINPTIKRQDLIGHLNPHDTSIVNTWPEDGLEIMTEITKSNSSVQNLIRAIIHKFIEKHINKREIEQTKADKKIWKEILIPQKTRGVFSFPRSPKMKSAYIDSLLLTMTVSSIINDIEHN